MKKAILFDLDGTLTKSDEGIIKSVQYALKKMNQHVPHSNELKEFINATPHMLLVTCDLCC